MGSIDLELVENALGETINVFVGDVPECGYE